MCLIVFAWQPEADHPFILLGNRDEFYQRPTRSSHWWGDHPEIFAGRDMEAGGTWLGINKAGKIAALTNFRRPDASKYALSRGLIIRDFLLSSLSAQDFLDELHNKKGDYAGFNLVLYDDETAYYASNRHPEFQLTLTPGIYGLSNHLLDTPWPKVKRAKEGFRMLLGKQASPPIDDYFRLFTDTTTASDDELPETGIPREIERQLSSIFIKLGQYGTRSSTLLTANLNGDIEFIEKSHPSGSGSTTL